MTDDRKGSRMAATRSGFFFHKGKSRRRFRNLGREILFYLIIESRWVLYFFTRSSFSAALPTDSTGTGNWTGSFENWSRAKADRALARNSACVFVIAT